MLSKCFLADSVADETEGGAHPQHAQLLWEHAQHHPGVLLLQSRHSRTRGNFGFKNTSWSRWLPGKVEILNVLMVRECKRKRWDRERKCTSPENCPLYMKTSALRSSSLIPILNLMLIFLMIWLNLSLDTDSSCRIWRQQWNYCRPNYLLEGGTISSCHIHVFALQH